MKKFLLWVCGILLFVFLTVLAVGYYKFNILNDDIYIQQKDGTVIPFSEHEKTDEYKKSLENK